jgi:hypothetical protein
MSIEMSSPSQGTKTELDSRIAASWWKEFLVRTKNMEDSTLMKQSFSGDEKDHIRSKITDVLRRLFHQTARRKSFAFFLDGKEIPDQIAKDFLYENRIREGEDLEAWAARLFAERKFMIIVNHTEKISEDLSILVARYFQPLIATHGLPLNGIEIDIIIGDYGFTPLGIHRDGEGENLFHFHLGPNDKIMYNWDTEDYLKLPNGIQNCMEIEPMLPHGKKFTIAPQDVYYMPWTKFHIGYSPGFSIALVISFFNPTKKLYLDRLFRVIEDVYFDQNNREIALPEENLPDLMHFDSLQNVMKLREEIASKPVASILKVFNDLLVLRIASNCGLSSSPLLLEKETNYKEGDVEIFQNKDILSNKPFKIYFKSVRVGILKIFARLFVFESEASDAIVELIGKLNAGTRLSFNETMEEAKPEDREPIAALFSKLYNRRAICLL